FDEDGKGEEEVLCESCFQSLGKVDWLGLFTPPPPSLAHLSPQTPLVFDRTPFIYHLRIGHLEFQVTPSSHPSSHPQVTLKSPSRHPQVTPQVTLTALKVT